MESQFHNLTDLFEQLGLPADPASIDAFINAHRPLMAGARLCDAPFWSPAQAQFLRDDLRADADWSAAADALALRLSQPHVDLYAYWRTSATFRVRVALNLKGIAASERQVNLDAGEQRSPEFLKINPLAAIPALVMDGQPPLTQSLAILEFLEELQPKPPLLPSDLHGRARVRSIAGMLAADTHPLVTPRVRGYLTKSGGFDDAAWRAWQIQWFGTGLQAVEQRLANDAATGRFCHGDVPGMADICLASIVAVMRVFKIATSGTPTVDRIVAACDDLEAFRRADPMRQVGAPKG
jgi:maleylacetoacetate isomerase